MDKTYTTHKTFRDMRNANLHELQDFCLSLKKEGLSNYDIAERVLGKRTSESTIRTYIKAAMEREENQTSNIVSSNSFRVLPDNDGETLPMTHYLDKTHILKLEKQVQKLQDCNTALRREKRESYRDVNYLEALYESLNNLLADYSFTPAVDTKTYWNDNDSNTTTNSKPMVGVIQLSDIHFGERVEFEGETYFDIHICAARLKLFADTCIKSFKQNNVQKVVLALTGDMINSDRRLDELTMNSNARGKTLITAVDILQQFITYIYSHFRFITVASVVGNESRLNKDVGWTPVTGMDNFDFIIHEMLTKLFTDYDDITFVPMNDLYECLLDIEDYQLLLTHGNNKLATANPEPEVQKLKGRWSGYGHHVDYVIFGHIHSTLITDNYARSASIVGGNGYSNKNLNLMSKPSQNFYLIDTEREVIYPHRVDLSFEDSYNSFVVDDEATRLLPAAGRIDLKAYKV